MTTTTWANGRRPKNCPASIRRKYPGVTYPGPGYLQVRRGKASKSFRYSEHGIEGAHRAAAQWYEVQGGAPGLTTTVGKAKLGQTGGGLIYRTYVKGSIEHYVIDVPYRRPDGTKDTRTFFLGTENTWTQGRERVAHGIAVAFRQAYERWRKEGGVHPVDTTDFEWSAQEH